jgi:hypothetical protein
MRLAAAAVLALLSTPVLADPVGRYELEGTNPGSSSNYSGTVAVERTGETYRVVWNVGGTRYVGTGIGDKDFLAVSYRSGNDTGLALYGNDNGNWTGIWTYANGRQLGSERWSRR